MYIRSEIERVIKEKKINRANCFECSKGSYKLIIKKIEQRFVLHGGNIHWSNMGNGFNTALPCQTKNIAGNSMWIENLPVIIPAYEKFVYALFEDSLNFKPKYWLYEMCLPELICIINEVNGLGDFYIVSKKFNWLISECHEDIVSFVGSQLNLSCFKSEEIF